MDVGNPHPYDGRGADFVSRWPRTVADIDLLRREPGHHPAGGAEPELHFDAVASHGAHGEGGGPGRKPRGKGEPTLLATVSPLIRSTPGSGDARRDDARGPLGAGL